MSLMDHDLDFDIDFEIGFPIPPDRRYRVIKVEVTKECLGVIQNKKCPICKCVYDGGLSREDGQVCGKIIVDKKAARIMDEFIRAHSPTDHTQKSIGELTLQEE
jgi:hypothetical protein